jgi:KaiC/GvpD/RAD55 family RecA-like ATPase
MIKYPTVAEVLEVAKTVPVFPACIVVENSKERKKPRFSGWQNDATKDPSWVSQWWTNWPESLVAVPTGHRSGLLVVDIDKEAGKQWYAANRKRLGVTRVHTTRRGYHLIYLMPAGLDLRNSESKIAENVDVRANDGYAVWWPAHGFTVQNADVVAEPPQWLVDEIKAAAKERPANDAEAVLNSRGKTEHSLDQYTEALKHLSPGTKRSHWRDTLMGLHHQFDGSDAALAVAIRWSSGALVGEDPPKNWVIDGDVQTQWESFKTDRPDGITGRTIIKMLQDVDAEAARQIFFGKQPATRRLYRATDFIERPLPTWRVDGVVPEVGMGVIFGDSGDGKTTLALHLASAIAQGKPWFDRDTEQAQVAIVAAEDPSGVGLRLKALAQTGEDVSNVLIYDYALPVANEAEVDQLIEALKQEGGAKFVLIDTLTNVTPGIDENSKEMQVVVTAARRITDALGAFVLIVHHTGKDSTRGARGWSGLRAAADTMIETKRVKEFRRATITKQKNGRDGGTFSFTLSEVVVGHDARGREVTACLIDPDASFPGMTKSPDDLKGLGKDQRRVLEVARSLLSMGTDSVSLAALVDEAVKAVPPPQPPKKDERRKLTRRVIESLVEKQALVVTDGQVRLP